MKNPFRRRSRPSDEEIAEEIRHHLQLESQIQQERGATAEEAAFAARRDFGNVLLVKEVTSAMWRANVWQGIGADFRHALRTLRHSPGFTALAVLTLATGIAANTAIFSVVHHVLIRPLPYPEPEQLVWINEISSNGQLMSNSYPNFKDWSAHARSFSAMASAARAPLLLTGISDAAQMTGRLASAEFLEILGAQPSLGRLYTKEDDRPGGPPVVVLNHTAWQTHFGADPNIVGKNIRLDGELRTVIGVLPSTFAYYRGSEDFYIPLSTVEKQRDGYMDRSKHLSLQTIARLRPGVGVSEALAEMKGLAENLAKQYPVNSGLGIRILPFSESIRARLRPLLLILWTSVALVLLIACENVANLLLARVIERRREITVRSALGAGRWQIVRQLLCESLLLAAWAGVIGTAGAVAIIEVLRPMIPNNYQIMREAEVSIPVLLFALGASFSAALLFGILPAFHASGMSLIGGLNAGGRRGTSSRSTSGFRRALLVSEIGLAVVLATGSVLLIRSLRHAIGVDLGFEPDRLLTAEIRLPEGRYDKSASMRFNQRLHTEMTALAGVTGATTVMCLPVDGSCWGSVVEIEGNAQMDRSHWPRVQFNVAGPAYFGVMGIPLRSGRVFDAQDEPNAPKVAVLNEIAARTLFGDENPIGKQIRQGWPENQQPWRQIVGVVAGVKQGGPTADIAPEIFFPFTQEPGGVMWPILRTSVQPGSLIQALRSTVGTDPDLPLHNVKTMEERVDNSFAARRFTLTLIGTFGAIALLLAAVGLFGAISYAVQQRTREIAIRMALGARSERVLRDVLGEGFVLCVAGVLSGYLAGLALMRFIRSLLFGVDPHDPFSAIVVGLLVVLIGLAATGVPAWTAARVDPVSALRHE